MKDFIVESYRLEKGYKRISKELDKEDSQHQVEKIWCSRDIKKNFETKVELLNFSHDAKFDTKTALHKAIRPNWGLGVRSHWSFKSRVSMSGSVWFMAFPPTIPGQIPTLWDQLNRPNLMQVELETLLC